MTNYFVAIPSLESNIRLFGGHTRTVAGGWKFFGQIHQSFELMCVTHGKQITRMKNLPPMIYGTGEVLIISPGTWHVNENASQQDSMTYITCHFDIGDLELKAEIISKIANVVFSSDSFFAKETCKIAKKFIQISADKGMTLEEQRLEIQMTFLEFLLLIVKNKDKFSESTAKYTDREAQLARSLATLIADDLKSDHPSLSSFEDNCQILNISTGYGHRVFKKVYGITPLHYLEEKKYSKAKILLGSPEYSIEQVSQMIGAQSLSSFSKQFKKWSGSTPSKYQQNILHKRSVTTIKGSGYFE
ncbi:helix-turn-helix domain-containing protein [Levilactobacillus namurensis]|uniref:helix-turn-helix domain-containing protein n=2 Tax=Levilactobacillus namurensis TaxID=380393 RepID=UPI00222FD380|nr:AraC family transcriptional regulator [Levilactobacillus namurensis]MCW3778542.1 AraC family transcriptional regulator [Levilactobacillus namurensis]